MLIQYEDWNPKVETLELLGYAKAIIEQYQSDGYTMTLRQLYYRLVATGVIENTERSYKNLGTKITKARLAGMISWTAIEDRNREHHSFWTEESEEGPIADLPRWIRFDKWARQDTYVEVWVEKEALGNVIERACNPYIVPYMACKGYLSASEAWRAGRRMLQKVQEGKDCVIIHLGDHDPSGIDMTRDNQDRLNLFSQFEGSVKVERIALNLDQVREFNPPPNPAKWSDSRASDYVSKYGRSSWELDAIEPKDLEPLITDKIRQYIDFDEWDNTQYEEQAVRDNLRKLSDNWPQVKEMLEQIDE